MSAAAPVLAVRDLQVYYHTRQGPFRVVDGVDLDLQPHEIFGIAGESGCGKSTVVEGILRLVQPPGRIEAGSVHFSPRAHGGTAAIGEVRRGHTPPAGPGGAAASGVGAGTSRRGGAGGKAAPPRDGAADLLSIRSEAMRRMRWRQLAYVPQGSMNALNPVLRVREQMIDAMVDHGAGTPAACAARLPELLRAVGLAPSVLALYAHQLSGGMRQRVVIAASIALDPEVIVADEPTTALDVHAQRLILQTLRAIRRRAGVAMIFVSHDLAVHAELVDRLGVMYAGQLVEVGSVDEVFAEAAHPYTWGLVHSMPRIGAARQRLYGIPGLAPSPLQWPSGCRFHPRCPYAFARCREQTPARHTPAPGRSVACHLHDPAEAERLADVRARMRQEGDGGARLRAMAEPGGGADGR